jgi:hypothetical protein
MMFCKALVAEPEPQGAASFAESSAASVCYQFLHFVLYNALDTEPDQHHFSFPEKLSVFTK